MLKRVFGFGCLVLLALGIVPARAQEGGQPAIYTYVAEWAVPREQWRDYAKASADEKVAMDKLVADGTLIGYGDFSITRKDAPRMAVGLLPPRAPGC